LRCFTALLLCSLLLPATLCAQDPDHVMELVSTAAVAGGTVEVPILFDNALELSGYYLAVAHEPAELTAIEVLSGQITIELDPGFLVVMLYPDGFTLGVVYMTPWVYLPIGEDWEVHRIVYQVDSETPLGPSPVTYSDDIGNPPFAASMAIWLTGANLFPTLVDGTVEVVDGMLRGDTNLDGAIDLADPIFLAMWLFVQGDAVPCVDAADGNDDGSVDVGDVVTILAYLFQSSDGVISGSCEVDPTLDTLDCTVPNCP